MFDIIAQYECSWIVKNWNLIALERTAAAVYVSSVQGRVQVTIGKEDHKFTEGSFTTFGEQMLEQVNTRKTLFQTLVGSVTCPVCPSVG